MQESTTLSDGTFTAYSGSITNVVCLGVGTAGPDRIVDILDNDNPQLRLSHTDGSKDTDFQSTTDSLLEISPVGASTANALRINSNSSTCRMYMKGSSGSNLHIGVHSGSGTPNAFSGMKIMELLNLELTIQKRMRLLSGGNLGLGVTD